MGEFLLLNRNSEMKFAYNVLFMYFTSKKDTWLRKFKKRLYGIYIYIKIRSITFQKTIF